MKYQKKTAKLLESVSDLCLKPVYRIFNRDLEGVKNVLGTRFIEGYVERPETDRLNIYQNIVIYGKPEIGKTTEIYRIIKRYNPELVVIITNAFRELSDVYRLLREDLSDNFLVVWDDFHDNTKLFKVFNAFKQFVDRKELDGLEQFYKSSLFFGMSYYYSEKIKESKTKAELSFNLEKAIEYIEEAIGIRRELGLKADLADSLAISVFVYSKIIEFYKRTGS